jgi:hypothetical protein
MIKLIIVLLSIILLLIAHLSLINSSNSISSYMNQHALAAQDSADKFPLNIFIDSLNNNIVMTNPKETSFSVYDNPTHGIKILYPAGWNKLEFGQITPDGLVVGFALPREGKPLSEINVSDFILENILIAVTRIISDSSFSKSTILKDFVNEQILSFKQRLADFQIIKSNTTAIDNNPTYQIQYTSRVGHAIFDTLQIWTISGNKIYTMIFNADPADYSTYLPIIQKMTNSLVIFNNNNNNQMKFKNV